MRYFSDTQKQAGGWLAATSFWGAGTGLPDANIFWQLDVLAWHPCETQSPPFENWPQTWKYDLENGHKLC